MITFDPNKQVQNVTKHGMTFEGCEALFDNPIYVIEDTKADYGEQRLCVYGWLHNSVVCLVYLDQDDSIRVISLRKATKYETNKYFKYVSP